MEIQSLPPNEKPPPQPPIDYHSYVDTSRPFNSVKEAVAIFGERFLAGEIYSPKPPFSFPKQETPWNKFSPNSTPQISKQASWHSISSSQSPSNEDDDSKLGDTLKKLEAELQETKMELKLLKERESETEVALASLNAELHKNMSKIAQAEAAAAAKAVASRSVSLGRANNNGEDVGREKENKERDMIVRMEDSPTLAEILSIGDKEGLFGDEISRKKGRKMMKKKPIIPLVGDLFSRKKGASTTMHNTLYSSPHHAYWN